MLNDVLPDARPQATTSTMAALAAQVRADMTQRALLELLQAFIAPGSVLAFDDAQYLDSASWTLLSAACREVRGAMIVIAARPPKGRVGFDFYQITRLPSTTTLTLEPFATVNETRQLVASLLDAPQVAASFVQEVHNKSEGNPFVAVEMVQSVKALPNFRITTNGDMKADKDPIDYIRNAMPRNVTALITSKIDRLPLSQQTVLKHASVVGNAFTTQMVKLVFN